MKRLLVCLIAFACLASAQQYMSINGVPNQVVVLPVPTASALGGIESIAQSSNNWVQYIDTSGIPHLAQPSFNNLSGSATCAQLPALTSDVTTSAGSCTTTVGSIGGHAVSLAGAFTMSGAYGFTGTLTATTSITFPTSGTLAVYPTPTRTGDVIYWNGSSWVSVAGNNAGTQWLQETSGGVPSWSTPAGSGNVSTSGSPAQYQIGIWASGTTIGGVSPSSTSGVPLISAGASANPTFGAINLAGGSSIVTGILPAGNIAAALSSTTSVNGTSIPASSSLAILGLNTFTKTQTMAVNTVASGTSPSFDLSQGNIQYVSALAAAAVPSFTNITAGGRWNFIICNGSSGYSWTWPASVHGGMSIGATASKCLSQEFTSPDGSTLYGGFGIVNQ